MKTFYSFKPAVAFKHLLFLLVVSGFAFRSGAQLVFNQIYTGGGTNGALYNASYVQLLNQSNKKSISLKGLSVQFNSGNGSAWEAIILPDVVLAPGNTFIVGGTTNPAQGAAFFADMPNTSLDLQPAGSSVVLIEQTSVLTDCPQNNNKVIELVGWGDATCYIQKALAASTNTTAFYRKSGSSNTSLTGSNFAKFRVAIPNPLGTSEASTLPIKLEQFTGQVTKSGNQLQWRASLTGPSSFTLERSANGINFIAIASLHAAATGTENFAYTDAGAKGGTMYYRLQLSDEAGSRSFSNILKLGSSEQKAQATLYPTVAQSQIQVLLPVENKQTLSYRVVSLDGRVLLNGAFQPQQGLQTYSLAIGVLAKGHYLLCLQATDGQTQTLHFIKN